MKTDRLRHDLIGAASKFDCCPALCDYRPEAIKHYLDVVLDMERAGEDPCQRSATARYGIDGGSSRSDGPAAMWDVQRAVKELRAAGREVTAGSVAAKLCPWALEDAGQ